MPRLLSVAGRGRVKTLYLDIYWNPLARDCPLSDLISSFPSLENIFFDSPFPVDVNLLPTGIQIQVKVMQIGIKHLGNLAIPGHFRELTWLSFDYEMNSITLLSVLKVLPNLPNLQFLRFFPWFSCRATPIPILTLPKLTVLISNLPILHIIHAPKLLYLDITPRYPYLYPIHSPNNEAYDHLCGFDFSRITHIWCDMQIIHGSSPPHTILGPGLTYRWHKIYNTSQSLLSRYRNNHGLEWIFDDFDDFLASDLDCPSEFCLSFGARDLWEPPGIIPILILYIAKATNLVEIVLDDSYPAFLNHTGIEFLSMALRSATTVCNLIVLSGISLQTLCDLLSDGNLVPNLERLCYTTIDHEDDGFSSYILNSLRKLKERHGTRTRGLEIELKGFHSIQSQDLEEIEKLGLLRQEEIAENSFNFFISIIGSRIGGWG